MSHGAERKAFEQMSRPYKKRYTPFVSGDSIVIAMDLDALQKHGITKEAVQNGEVGKLDEFVDEDEGEIRIDLES